MILSNQRKPETIYVTLTRGRRYATMGVVVPALLMVRPDGYDAVRHVINSWNELANVPNGQMWAADLHDTIDHFRSDWRARTMHYYYNALLAASRKDDTKSGLSTLPAEVLWQVSARATDSLWQQMVQMPCKSVCVVEPDSWPNPRDRPYWLESRDAVGVLQVIVLCLRLLMREFPCSEGEPTDLQKAAGLRASACRYNTWWQWHCVNIAQQIRTVYLE